MKLLLLLMATLLAVAYPDPSKAQQRQICPVSSKEKHSCDCQAAVAGFHVASFRELRLVAICGHQRLDGQDEEGEFFFRGNLHVSGKLVYQLNDSLGETYSFRSPELPLYLNGIRFDYNKKTEELAQRSFRAPAIKGTTQCWQAEATLNVRSLYLNRTGGTDAEGPFATEFSLVRRSRYSACG